MKYLRQFGINSCCDMCGRGMKYFIPLPIPRQHLRTDSDVCTSSDKGDQSRSCERNRRVFNRDHAAYVYSCGSRADHFMESAAVFSGATACDHSGIYICSHDRDRKSNRFFNFKKRGEKVIWIICLSYATIGIVISLLAYEIGLAAQRKWKLAILNPLLISIALVIVFLVVFHVDYDSYNMSAKYLKSLVLKVFRWGRRNRPG